ncbi:MAG: LOG family protein [Planctomycetota bacterium]
MTDLPIPVSGPNDPAVTDAIDELSMMVGVDPETLEGRQISQMLHTVIKLIPDGRHAGELKLLNASLKELRYAYSVFANYADTPKITIFGSARTPENHPDYRHAVEFARAMAEHGWMIITGAGDGIMKAGHEGPGRTASFGVAIRLPFETTANEFIAGDEKLINFRYFFTRKLMFVSQSNAVALFPGGFGTQDENFETLTLIQTGKSHMVPVVLLEGGEGGATRDDGYWSDWTNFIRRQLLDRGWISPEDMSLFYAARDSGDAVDHILQFYRNYHSARYVREQFVIRLKHSISEEQIDEINTDFADLVESGSITQRKAFDAEDDVRDLPRICFHHNRRKWGRVRELIDRLNAYVAPSGAPHATERGEGRPATRSDTDAAGRVPGKDNGEEDAASAADDSERTVDAM